MRLGVLTGGGDCPGLNAVIRAIVRKGVGVYGHEFVGYRDGWRGPLEGDWRPLGVPEVRGILPRGGTILGSSRTNPIKEEGGADRIAANLERDGVDGLIAIGGEDTLGVAQKLHEAGINVVGVPKTIDNDLGATDYTFGFDTAVNIAMGSIDRLHTTAESHKRTLIVEVMGRHAGWIALHAGLAGGANVILIPEHPFDLDRVCDYIERALREPVRADRRRLGGRRARGRDADRRGRADRRLRPRRASAGSATGWRARSSSAPGTRRGRPCSATSSAAAPRPRSTASSRPASGCTRSTPPTRRAGAR